MREEVQMQNALKVITGFQNREPLHRYLKEFFRQNKQMGSRDRKILSALVYGYYRKKGKQLVSDPQQLVAIASAENGLLNDFYTWWKEKLQLVAWQQPDFNSYFPLAEHVSRQININAFYESHFVQPYIWIRCKTNRVDEVRSEMQQAGYTFEIDGRRIGFQQPYPLEQTEAFKKGYFEVQDIASQHTAELFDPQKNEAWWDCCAGAGGKSLILLEQQPQIQLFVSDIRESILNNLSERFYKNDIHNFNAMLCDITDPQQIKRMPQFDAIIADVPCSGSGTWGRTPEWLSFFTAPQLEKFVALQRKIISAVTEKLKPGGKLIYITCSVYADENEHNVKWFTDHLHLKIESEKYFQFSEKRGDTMYGVVMERMNNE